MSEAIFSWNSLSEKKSQYEKAKQMAENNYQEFWHKEAQRISWHAPFSKVHDGGFENSPWFLDGQLNASFNCLDRHVLGGLKDKIALISENELGEIRQATYQELLELTKNISSHLLSQGVKAGDRVAIYMPMTIDAVASMLACARIGAVHTVIFGGFSSEAIVSRIQDANAKVVITAEKTFRKGKELPLLALVNNALADQKTQCVSSVLVFGKQIEKSFSNSNYKLFSNDQTHPEEVTNPKAFDSSHPLFILYTSGTTGKPKGIFHTTGGYLTQVVSTSKWIFDFQPNDIYWCSADVGWITGHSYVCYGPLALGATQVIYDGALNCPDNSRVYEILQRHKVSIFYTAPTAIRMFMSQGEQFCEGKDLSSLRLLGTVGEPINPEAWRWYKKVFGKNNCPIIDSWWQTETGAMMIAPIPEINSQKPGSASTPFLGINAKIVDEKGVEKKSGENGFLVVNNPWPSLAAGVWGDNKRFHETYFSQIPGRYFTGDGAYRDNSGDFFISGRIDDVVNVSGHRLGTAEIESALVAHESVAEAAVVGIPDEITGQKLAAFVCLMKGHEKSAALEQELKDFVKNSIGSFAKPAILKFEVALPKTRSGKIMRRLLRSVAMGEKISSDTSTLEDESILDRL